VRGEQPAEGVRNSEGGTCRVRQTREKRTHAPMSLEGRNNPTRGARDLRVEGRPRGRFPDGGQACGRGRDLRVLAGRIAEDLEAVETARRSAANR
jgi:hypothetical protein